MIGVLLNGGLGNMMFQIAALEDMGRRSGYDTCYPDLISRLAVLVERADHSQNAFDYLTIFRNFCWLKNSLWPPDFDARFDIPHKYIHLTPRDKSLYVGYFQSERYFDRDETLKLFEPSDDIKARLQDYDFTDSCSIHVRHGDYMGKYAGVYSVPGMDYYIRAMELTDAGKYYVFTDDIPWCQEMFTGSKYVIINESPEVSLFMMSRCTHNIIANSSFSWWGSYLNLNPDKMIVAPSSWYDTYKYSAMDIYCNNWTII